MSTLKIVNSFNTRFNTRRPICRTSSTRKAWGVNRRAEGVGRRAIGVWRWMAAVLLFAAPLTRAAAQNVPGHVLVRIQPTADIHTLEDEYDTHSDDGIPDRALYALHTPDGTDDATFAQQLNATPGVVYAVPDVYLELPDIRGKQFHLAFDAGPKSGAYVNQEAYRQVHLGAALKHSTGAGVTVAVLDTGASFEHPALKKHYLPGYNALQPDAAPIDAPDGLTNEAVGHGTMIAGIIAKLAPKAKILPVKVLDADGNGTVFTVLQGLDYAVNHGAKVINMSFGASTSSQALADGFKDATDAEVVLVAAAGNEAADWVDFPAAYEDVIAVTSVEADDVLSSYANYGPQIQFVAPGDGIRSTYINNGYATWSGTSFATPFVAAEAALVISKHPNLELEEVLNIMSSTAHSVDNSNPNLEEQLGDGLIDIDAAVMKAPGSGD